MLVGWLIARHGGRRVLPLHRLRLAAMAPGVAILAALLLPNRLTWRSDSPYRDTVRDLTNYREGSGRGRLIQYENSLRLIRIDPVFGTGPGNWPVKYPLVTTRGDPSFAGADPMPTNPWPSSDWVAMASERGFLALGLLLLTGGTIALGAWARVRRGEQHVPAVTDLAIVATVLTVAVVGAFDAVLLLPVPTLFAWTIVGTLASSARPIREIPLTSRSRRGLMMVVAVVGALFLARGATQAIAMGVFDGGERKAMESAAALDPGSYRIRMLLARAWARAGRCDRAIPHATAARELFPNHPAPVQLLRACGVRKRR
jgi:hypothetical protein